MSYKYKNIRRGKFISRPNRFIANVEIDGEVCVCHVKNTGRCKELLIKGCTVILEESSNPARKTKYDLIAVYKGDLLINMDSQVPNKCAAEFIPQLFENVTLIKPECTHKNSRFDFYIETPQDKIFLEVKGVTLEENGTVKFPDAPTERGVKHLKELTECVSEGYGAYVLFVVQMNRAERFMPNFDTHPEFGQALREAVQAGVKALAYRCDVAEDSIEICGEVPVILSEQK
ncbi:MAG: DNA/RNA nuclease SfsA [Oscillospiraceae bacterium]